MPEAKGGRAYFPHSIQISQAGWTLITEGGFHAAATGAGPEPFIVFARRVAAALASSRQSREGRVSGGELNLFALLNKVYRHVIDLYGKEQNPDALKRGGGAAGFPPGAPAFAAVAAAFADHYPPHPHGGALAELDNTTCLTELILLRLAMDNPALLPFLPLFDDANLAAQAPHRLLVTGLEAFLDKERPVAPFGLPLPQLLRAPFKASPRSLAGQIEFIRTNWGSILPPDLLTELLTALDIAREEERQFFGGPGNPQVLEFLKGGRLGRGGHDYPEYERFSVDSDWMANVVMIAKMTYVWLDQLSRRYGREVHRLDQVPDEELDRLARWGFTALWLIGVWERSPASQKIKQIGGNPDAISSAYSLYDYTVARDLGGEEALENLKERCRSRGMRLASDMVPNHTGIYSRWTVEHPDWFVQLDYPPYPAYAFTGPDLSFSPEVSLHIEDGYWDRRDAAVVFKHYDHRDGRTRYIYHGNDGTSTPWNDTAQLNYLLPAVREAVIRTILHVARQFPIIRFDAAMTLAKKHYQRLWFPQPGHGSGVPSRAEHGMTREDFDRAFPQEFWREVVDRVAAEAPDTLLLAEAFWLMEGYFVRTLGMHRVYNSAFMNMLKMEENAKYRQTVKNVLEFDPEILKRFVNFMNNPDERTAIEQFGREGKYFGACVLLVTMPGLPMFGHGQIEGFHEKYGMEYRRAYWNESEDEHLVSLHERTIFPLMHRRWLFSGSRNFVFYDFFAGGHVNEDVFAYSNREGGERGVVIYHNRFADTSGWVRTSTAIARNGAGGKSLVQTTLGEALGFDPGDGVFYGYRDYASGLEYLRSGRELCEQGLYVVLGGYQFYVLLDFRELRDDGSWGELCRRLAGRPVASLDAEVKQVRFEREINLFRELLDTHPPVFAGSTDLAADGTATRLAAFCSAVAGRCGRADEAGLLAREVAAELMSLAMLAAYVGQSPEGAVPALARSFAVLAGSDVSRTLTLSWLYLHRLGVTAGDERGGAAEVAERFGLLRVVEEELSATSEAGEDDAVDLDPASGTQLLGILLRHDTLFADATPPGELFSDPAVSSFLHVHTSAGAEWFNKERFEFLLEWLAAVEVFGSWRERGDSDVAEASAGSVQDRLVVMRAAAGEAGYRVDRFTSWRVEE